MSNKLLTFAALISCLGAASGEARAEAVELTVNGAPMPVCEVGTCTTAGAGQVGSGQSIGPDLFSFSFTAPSGDPYSVSGTTAASYGSNGIFFQVNITATYTGAMPSVATDTFTVDDFENIYDPGPGSWAGTYTNSTGVTMASGLGAGSSTAVNLFWDSEGVGLLGPYTAPGTYDQSVSKSLDFGGLDSNAILAGDYKFYFTVGAGTTAGTTADSFGSFTPEPRETAPVLLLALLGLGWMRLRSRRSVVLSGKNI